MNGQAAVPPSETWLTGAVSPQERYERSRANRASGKAAQEAQRQARTEQDQARELTAAERLLQMQAQIIAEREERSAMTAQNRQMSMMHGGMSAIYDDAEGYRPVLDMDTGEIDIDLPAGESEQQDAAGQEPEEKQPEKPKKKQSKKEKSAKKHVRVKAKRKTEGGNTPSQPRGGYRKEENRPGGQYQGRITASSAISIGLMAVALIGIVIYGRVQTNEIYSEIAQKQTEYDDLVAKNVSMRSEMEGKMTVKNIQEYAENVLGLRQLHQSQIEYIQLQTEDEVVISEPEENFFVTINDYIKSFWELLRGQ